MRRAQSSMAFLAAAISAVLGVVSLVGTDFALPRTPGWRDAMAPLALAPLPHRTVVGLIDRLGERPSRCRFLLLEAAWRRPDVWWTRLQDFPYGSACTTVVTTDARPAPPGWTTVWRSRGLAVLQRPPA